MNTFYEIDSTKVSHLEYWWGTKSPAVIFGWLIKWLHIRIPSSSDDPNTESTLPFVVEALPPEIAAGFEPLVHEFAGFGFTDPVYHVINDPGTRTTVYWATFRHASGNYFARIHQRIWQQAQKPNRGLFPMFFSALADGTFIVSSSGKPDMAAPATVRMNRMFRAPAAKLWEKHQELTAQAGQSVYLAHSREDLITLTEQHHVLVRDFHLKRSVFRPRNNDEQAQADSFAASVAQAQVGGLEHAEVLAELQKLQEQKPSWKSAGWILAISLVLFVALGAARWNWRFTLLIIPVLLFHECGHWLAMRIFRYRNLRMFFIPLFGAAVTGQNWNVPGWKKAIVSLAGPLPGIALGMILGIIGLILKKPLLNEAALLLVFVNGLNLLPVLPFDGGRVLQSILFCRNRWLNVAFQVLAIAGMVLLGVAGLGKFLMYLAIPMAIYLPVAIKLGKVTDDLRLVDLPPPSPDGIEIPVPTAQAIITKIKAAFPSGVGNKALAQHTLNVFETLNAKPPGAFATIGLLLVHGGALLLAVVFSFLLLVGKIGGLGDFARAAMRQPQHAFQCGGIQCWPVSEAPSAAARTTLVATFSKHLQAETEFTALKNHLPADGRLTLFGDSLLLTLPAAADDVREKMFTELQAATTNVFVAVSNQPVALNLICIAPTAVVATNLSRELQNYCEVVSGMHLLPPWSPAAKNADFEKFRAARQEWKTVQTDMAGTFEDPELKNYYKKISAATRRGALTEAAWLEEEQHALSQKLQASNRDRLLATATPTRKALIELNWELTQLAYTNRVERAQLLRKVAANLGEVQFDGDTPAPGADAMGATSGMAFHHSLMVELSWISLRDPATSLPALTDWLCEHHCVGIKYDFEGAFSALETDDSN